MTLPASLNRIQMKRPPFLPLIAAVAMIIASVLFVPAAAGQTLSGTVTDATTGNAVAGATVFVANTTISGISDASGAFSLSAPPQYTFEVVAAIDGYAPAAVLATADDEAVTIPISAAEPMPAPGGSTDMNEKDLMEFFESTAFSWTNFSRDIEIVNPEALQMTHDAANNVMTVTSNAPFEFDNLALGYKIKIYDFQMGGNQIGFGWQGFALYIPLQPDKSKDEKKWKKNRETVYEGTLRHFLASLAAENLKKAEWQAFFVDGPGSMPDENPIAEAGLRSMYGEPTPVMYEGNSPTERKIDFAGWVGVEYFGSGGDARVERYVDRFWPISQLSEAMKQVNVTYFQMPELEAFFHESGVLVPTTRPPTQQFGYWTFFRLADMVPHDFMPEE